MSYFSSFRLRLPVIALFAMAALPCFAGDVAVLRNGFSIKHERREVVGELTRLYVSADGSSFVDVPTAEIEHFEAAPELPASGSPRPAPGKNPQSPLLAKDARNGAPVAPPFPRSSPVNLDEVVTSTSVRARL